MKKIKNGGRILAFGITAALAVSSFAVIPAAAASSTINAKDYQLSASIQNGNILHCFDWKYSDIKAELPNIAKAGFTSIQTSPAQASGSQGSWVWLYQPLGFSVQQNGLGTKAELKELCDEAEKYGINVIVDVVANHLSDNHEIIQDDLKPAKYWHTLGKITNYSNRNQVINGEIDIKDLKSEDSYVQSVVAKYVDELKSIGVDGIRWDAAKHIGLPSENCNFWKAVTGKGLYNYGEILGAPVDGSNNTETAKKLMKEYTDYMSVTDNGYGNGLLASFRNGKAPASTGNWSEKGISTNKLVYWGESHDTYSNGEGKESNGATQNEVDRAYAVAAARNGSSALYFSRPAATASDSIRIGDKGSMHFTSPEISAVNHFHNAMAGKADSYAVSNNCSVVTRKDGGAVIVMGSGSGKVEVTNAGGYAKPGTYKDEVTGNTFVITKDKITGTVGSSGIAVVYNSSFTSRVEASVETGTSFKTDSLKVTLKALDVKSPKYQIDGAAAKSFTNGTAIELGKNAEPGTSITLTLTATNSSGKQVTAVYNYLKEYNKKYPTLNAGGMVFDNSKTKWSKINVYVYDESVDKNNPVTNAKWPGVAMESCGDNLYKYMLPSQFSECRHIMVIFNNGSGDQIPRAMAAGMSMSYTEKKLYDGTNWVELPVVKEEIKPTGVSFDKTSITLEKGKTQTLTAKVLPTNAENKAITWSSSNNSIATVSSGKITAKAVGTATITAKTVNGKTATCKVTVKAAGIAVSSVKLDKSAMSLGKGETTVLKATVSPSNAANKTVSWRTSNSKVLTVDQKGNVKAVGTGTAWITAKSSNGKESSCKITVKNAPAKITLTKGILTIGVGEKYTIGSGIDGNAACAKRTYRTSNSSVVKMTRTDWNGVFVGQKPGIAYVTVRTYNGKESTCKVTVKAAPSWVKLNKTSITLKVGQSASLSAVIPDKTGCATRTFSSSNSNIVKMTKTNWTGSFKAMKPGVAYVTVRAYNGKESSCKVTVLSNTTTPATKKYILNTSTKCYHSSEECKAAKRIAPENFEIVNTTEAKLKANGYHDCGICCK